MKKNRAQLISNKLEALNYLWKQFTIDEFINFVGKYRGKEIHCIGIDGIEVPVVIATPKADYIFFNQMGHPSKKLHEQLHEVSHLLLNHIRPVKLPENLGDILGLHLAAKFRSPSSQNPNHDIEEEEAEYLTYLILEKIDRYSRFSQLTQTDESDGLGLSAFTEE
jgi:hypothetical protein